MTCLPAVRDEVLVERFGDGVVVFEPDTALLHVLNAEAALVLQACNRGWSAVELVAEVARASGVARNRVRVDVETCLAELRHVGVVAGDDATASPSRPAEDSGVHVAPPPVPAPTGALTSRAFAVLDEVIVIRADDRDLLDRVDSLFADLVVDRAPTQRWSITIDADGARLVGLTEPGTVFHDANALVNHLPTILNEVAATSTTCLALHAGVVRSPSGVVVVLPAISGSGKSTLTAWLVQQGWEYLSDETAAIRPGSLSMVPYPKPLALDGSSRSLVGLNRRHSANVPSAELRSGAAMSPDRSPPVGQIVLVNYQAGAATTLVPIQPEAAVLAVAPHALNLRWVGPPGLAALVHLVTTVPCHSLTHGGVSDAQDALLTVSNSPI